MNAHEFHQKLVEAKAFRHLTMNELVRMTQVSERVMGRWLEGLSSPSSRAAREAIIRLVE